MIRRAVLAALLLSLTAALASPAAAASHNKLTATQPPLPAPTAAYQRTASIALPGGLVRDAVWLDGTRLLVLQQQVDGASVLSVDYAKLTEEPFISSSFMAQNVCPANSVSQLSWLVGPRRKHIFFTWPEGETRHWALLDISTAPQFRLKRMATPEGMQVTKALFSPDERYIALVHDGTEGTCDVSVLVVDLSTGGEVWRVDSHKLSFIENLWWAGPVFDSPRFFASAKLHDGVFQDVPGLALFDLNKLKMGFSPSASTGSLLVGASALWGHVDAYSSLGKDGKPEYRLQAVVPGQKGLKPLGLSSPPLHLQCLSIPGLVLVSNTADFTSYELWLVNLLTGDKQRVDGDCGSYDAAPDNRLLVRSHDNNALRIYDLGH